MKDIELILWFNVFFFILFEIVYITRFNTCVNNKKTEEKKKMKCKISGDKLKRNYWYATIFREINR